MKNFTSLLFLLFMAMVVRAQTEATVTLVHTASSYCTEPANAYTSTVDAEKEHINNSRFGSSDKWQGAAYAEFTVTLPEGNYSISKASLIWTGVSANNKNRTTDVMYVNAGGILDYETMASTGTEKVNLSATNIETVTFPANATTNFTTDVTDAVKTIIGGGQAYIIFKFTNNAGGGDLVGKGASENYPVLKVELANASSMTTYTVKYVDESGNEIADAFVEDIVIGEVASVTDANKAAIYTADKKYIYVSCDKESITTVEDATSNVITVTFREAATYSYTANAVDGESNILKELANDSYFEGEAVKVLYSRYIFKDNVLYEKAANGSEYSNNFTLSANNAVFDVVYNISSTTDAYYFNEAEDIEGLTRYEDGYTNVRMSNGVAAYAPALTTIITLPAGIYTLQSASRVGSTTFYADSKEVLTLSSEGTVISQVSEQFAIYKPTEIKVSAGNNKNYFDYVLICRLDDAPVRELVVTDGENLNATDTYTSATYERLFNTDYNYGTICLPFAPDEATCANYTFYKLAEANSEALIFEEETEPKANIAYLYTLKEGVNAESAKTLTGGVTTISDIEVNEVGSWSFIGAFQKTTIEDLSDGLYYAYKPTAEKDILTKATKTLTVHPFRAYFKYVETETLNFAPATATMRLVIDGQDGDVNAIEKVIAPEEIEGAVFDIEGRPVQEMQKGKVYIIGGKKVMK